VNLSGLEQKIKALKKGIIGILKGLSRTRGRPVQFGLKLTRKKLKT
jgi:hypothetical protein